MRQKRTRIALASASSLILLLTAIIGCAKGPGKIELSATEYDFGTISNRESVSQVFEVHNVGRGQLEITGVSTSCGCTTAETDKRQLAPGETAKLKVTYDPQAHDGATGRFMRMVYVRSDDPDVPETTLTIRVAVTEL
jgi:hypothetical protein